MQQTANYCLYNDRYDIYFNVDSTIIWDKQTCSEKVVRGTPFEGYLFLEKYLRKGEIQGKSTTEYLHFDKYEMESNDFLINKQKEILKKYNISADVSNKPNCCALWDCSFTESYEEDGSVKNSDEKFLFVKKTLDNCYEIKYSGDNSRLFVRIMDGDLRTLLFPIFAKCNTLGVFDRNNGKKYEVSNSFFKKNSYYYRLRRQFPIVELLMCHNGKLYGFMLNNNANTLVPFWINLLENTSEFVNSYFGASNTENESFDIENEPLKYQVGNFAFGDEATSPFEILDDSENVEVSLGIDEEEETEVSEDFWNDSVEIDWGENSEESTEKHNLFNFDFRMTKDVYKCMNYEDYFSLGTLKFEELQLDKEYSIEFAGVLRGRFVFIAEKEAERKFLHLGVDNYAILNSNSAPNESELKFYFGMESLNYIVSEAFACYDPFADSMNFDAFHYGDSSFDF